MREPFLSEQVRRVLGPGKVRAGAPSADCSPQSPLHRSRARNPHAHLTPRPSLSGVTQEGHRRSPHGAGGNVECAEDAEILLLKATRRHHLHRA